MGTGGVHLTQPAYTNWRCPFCEQMAILASGHNVLCYSRTCSCGALALAAPSIDTDEIIDDAINIFSIKLSEEAIGFDALMLKEIQSAGILIMEGKPQQIRDGPWGAHISYWFKRVQ